jgi:hypothetical protein
MLLKTTVSFTPDLLTMLSSTMIVTKAGTSNPKVDVDTTSTPPGDAGLSHEARVVSNAALRTPINAFAAILIGTPEEMLGDMTD